MLGPLEDLLNDGDGLTAEVQHGLEVARRNARWSWTSPTITS